VTLAGGVQVPKQKTAITGGESRRVDFGNRKSFSVTHTIAEV
jgi:hypothetical protein